MILFSTDKYFRTSQKEKEEEYFGNKEKKTLS